MSETADLLEALRRRRGEREAAVAEPEQPQLPLLAPGPGAGRRDPARRRRRAEPSEEKPGTAAALWGGKRPRTTAGIGSQPAKKGRAAMPSWDEIVFGARTDDDLA